MLNSARGCVRVTRRVAIEALIASDGRRMRMEYVVPAVVEAFEFSCPFPSLVNRIRIETLVLGEHLPELIDELAAGSCPSQVSTDCPVEHVDEIPLRVRPTCRPLAQEHQVVLVRDGRLVAAGCDR